MRKAALADTQAIFDAQNAFEGSYGRIWTLDGPVAQVRVDDERLRIVDEPRRITRDGKGLAAEEAGHERGQLPIDGRSQHGVDCELVPIHPGEGVLRRQQRSGSRDGAQLLRRRGRVSAPRKRRSAPRAPGTRGSR